MPKAEFSELLFILIMFIVVIIISVVSIYLFVRQLNREKKAKKNTAPGAEPRKTEQLNEPSDPDPKSEI